MVMNCPKCGSDDVDHATIGIAGSVQCVDCGRVFAYTKLIKIERGWPFPTSLWVKNPLNDNLPPKYNPANDDPSPL